MGDNDRIALMQMVKEGKITTETALQVVSSYCLHLTAVFLLLFFFFKIT